MVIRDLITKMQLVRVTHRQVRHQEDIMIFMVMNTMIIQISRRLLQIMIIMNSFTIIQQLVVLVLVMRVIVIARIIPHHHLIPIQILIMKVIIKTIINNMITNINHRRIRLEKNLSQMLKQSINRLKSQRHHQLRRHRQNQVIMILMNQIHSVNNNNDHHRVHQVFTQVLMVNSITIMFKHQNLTLKKKYKN